MRKVTESDGKVFISKGNYLIKTCILFVFFLGGCSQIPDAVNPVEWYKSSIDFFSGQDREEAPVSSQKKFSDLRSVDIQREKSEERARGLLADKAGRKYAPQVPRQSEVASVLSSPPPKPSQQVNSRGEKTPVIASSQLSERPSEPEPSILANKDKAEKFVSEPLKPKNRNPAYSRMAARLAEIKSMAVQNARLPIYSGKGTHNNTTETVIVSSSGIEVGANFKKLASLDAVKHTGLGHLALKASAKPASLGEVKVATILFANSSSSLSIKDRSILASVRQLQRERGGKIRIVGHASSRTRNTDPVSHKMINLKVSTARAQAVAEELVRMGVKRTHLQIDAVSDSAPVFHEYMPSGEAGNRRAEIYLVS